MSFNTLVSVVVPVLNEAKDLQSLLHQLRGQAAPRGDFEVLVVDGGSTDGTREIVASWAREWPSLRLLENPQKRSSPARNIGARESSGKYIVYIDGHCSIPREDYLIRLVEIFEFSSAHCLCRPQPLATLAEGEWGRAIAAARHSLVGHNPGSEIFGGEPGYTQPHSAGAAYMRDTIQALRGFDERFDACEDVEFNHRLADAGFTSYVHPDLSVDYRPRSTLRGLLKQMMRYGRGRARLMARHGLIPWLLLIPACFALSVVLFMLVAGRAGVLVGVGVFFLWILLLVVEGVRIGGFTASWMRIALSLATIHVGLVLGFSRGLVEFRRFRAPRPGSASESRAGNHHAFS
jgi:succinoglycan biosynthesis protein ExoA